MRLPIPTPPPHHPQPPTHVTPTPPHQSTGIERIRFATSHPRYFTERLIKACADLPKLCEFFHIPFQSGDDDILREMKRGYTAARYADIIYSIRRHMPDASVSGDAIVGFPGMGRYCLFWVYVEEEVFSQSVHCLYGYLLVHDTCISKMA